MTGLPSAIASSTTAPPHSNRLGRTRQSAAFNRALQSGCDSQPANCIAPAPSPRRVFRQATARAPTAAGAAARHRHRGSKAASAPAARGGEGLQQEVDALPADQPAHEHEGDDVARPRLAVAMRSTATGRRRSRPVRRRVVETDRGSAAGSDRSRPAASPRVACPASARSGSLRSLARTRPAPARAAASRAKAGGYSMPPFIGPMTTGAPRPNSKDGSRGETGIGWWITSMSCSRTSLRATPALRDLRRHARQEAGREIGDLIGQVLADPAHGDDETSCLRCRRSDLLQETARASSSRVRACVSSQTGSPRARSSRK